MAKRPSESKVSSGVEALIAKLREEGADAGRNRGEAIVADAEARANFIVSQAREEAERTVVEARTEADRLRKAAEEAMRVAARDTMLDLKGQLSERLSGDVSRLISDELRDEDMLKRMILEVAGRARAEAGVDGEEVEILLPRDVVGLDELRRDPKELTEGTLTHLVLALAGDMLVSGVSFGVAEDDEPGIRMVLKDKDLTVDLTDKAVADQILRHLQPRFRALLEGIVK